MNGDDIKDFAVETCQSACDMDIREISGALEKWGFKIVDCDNMTSPCPGAIACYMIWLECDYGLPLAKENLDNWFKELPKDVLIGTWHFVVKYWKRPGVAMEFPFDVKRYPNGTSRIRNLQGAVGVAPKDHDAKQWWAHTAGYQPSDDNMMSMLPPGMTVQIDNIDCHESEVRLIGAVNENREDNGPRPAGHREAE